MSLYNLLFGVNPTAPLLLAILGTDEVQVPRFRDCFLKGDRIVIHTRTGGGNRAEYVEQNARLRELSGFMEDHDDAYDSTYAHFVYAIPEKFTMTCKILKEYGAERDPEQAWAALFAKLQDPKMKDDPQVVEALAKMQPVIEQINAATGEGPHIIEV